MSTPREIIVIAMIEGLRASPPVHVGDYVLAALTAAGFAIVPVEPTEGWQPIETAPKDGTEILAWGTHYGHECVFWLGNDGRPAKWYTGTDDTHHEGTFTHWRPLPAPPAKQGG